MWNNNFALKHLPLIAIQGALLDGQKPPIQEKHFKQSSPLLYGIHNNCFSRSPSLRDPFPAAPLNGMLQSAPVNGRGADLSIIKSFLHLLHRIQTTFLLSMIQILEYKQNSSSSAIIQSFPTYLPACWIATYAHCSTVRALWLFTLNLLKKCFVVSLLIPLLKFRPGHSVLPWWDRQRSKQHCRQILFIQFTQSLSNDKTHSNIKTLKMLVTTTHALGHF